MPPAEQTSADFVIPWCISCGYSLDGLPADGEGRCPECGQPDERLPADGRFECLETIAGRSESRRNQAIGFMLGGPLCAAYVVWKESRRSALSTWGLAFAGIAAAAGVLLGLALLYLKPRSAGRRVVVDCRAQRVRFEGFLVERTLRLGVTAPGGLEVGLDELLGTETATSGLLVMIPAGRITVPMDFTNWYTLVAVLQAASPHRLPGAYSMRRQTVIFVSTMALIGAVLLCGLLAGWW